MKRSIHRCNALEIENLLAVEREILPEPQEVRNRVLERARFSLRHRSVALVDAFPQNPRRLGFGIAAAAMVMLTALCAVAFVAGYHARNRTTEIPTVESAVLRTSVPKPVSSSSLTATASESTSSAAPPTPSHESLGQSTPVLPIKSTNSAAVSTKSDGISAELRVLQPARKAVAQRDFNAALATLAEHQRLYPAGILSEEREGLRIKALIGLGRITEAKRASDTFRKRFPRSALLGRIDEMLGTKP
jgi:hypothetical protein